MLEKVLSFLRINQTFNTTIQLSAEDLHEHLKTKIDVVALGFISDATDAFGKNDKKFKGHLDEDKFLIKYKRTVFSGLNNIPIITGKISEENGKVVIKTSISALTGLTVVLMIVLTLAMVLPILFSMNTGAANGEFLLVRLVVFFVMLFFIYLTMRVSIYSVKKKIKSVLYQFDELKK